MNVSSKIGMKFCSNSPKFVKFYSDRPDKKVSPILKKSQLKYLKLQSVLQDSVSHFPQMFIAKTINLITFLFFRGNKIVSTALSVLVIGINIYFVFDTVKEVLDKDKENSVQILVGVSIYGVLYLLFCLYLVIHMAISMGATFLSNNYVSIID